MSASAALAIPNLLYRYAELIDARDLAGAAELLRVARVITPRSVAEGAEAILDVLASWIPLAPPGARTTHLITNPIIEVDDATATAWCRSQWMVLQIAPGRAPEVVACGSCRDSFAYAWGGWRFTEREFVEPELHADPSAQLLGRCFSGRSHDGRL